jgi:type VI secretion system protein ImpF
MASENSGRVKASILDRLLDFDPGESREPATARSIAARDLKKSVMRDLEWLLNTRLGFDIPESLEEVRKSVAYYGLPDFTALSIANFVELSRLKSDIEHAIKFFEPRLLDVQLIFEPITSTEKQIKFRVEARIDADPLPEEVAFDTVLNSGNGSFVISTK